MKRKMLKSKIHRATVTGADLHYEGSITIDSELMKQADILPYEAVDIWNVTYGTRFQTYAIEGQPGSGVICINGAAARMVSKGDMVIIASWIDIDADKAAAYEPKLVFVDDKNVPTTQKSENPGQGSLRNAI
ncbi:aspartate 1-decarboxylase [Syntrophotalea carbinolica DSM 2380]|uniref:Aspartate 1-decarboxylase n=1 Tax=Syntrophotalea carbinolica (strain DSM 2380 / NBRC 103641 / GraBd1) TaxID=338963 RepID=PAND_SYNC1|nr:aspartate 1-decarboxylase [Syntrophotalea carbinolica]Q3A3I8.1 RecName: Full=Aspartate 1-decarboxylase; AltName: Full=Aspartate alpha-decarboxylase; Contains: RecName: Full=Aspartate 1-decarboxylase beta chain; Contains: RecName: Full=Aspartate 1-decarboxylase alpha chain; Flags: Precursor [Syntrophotalea carbinolica DSM 2380]ABA89069.1 aspartate 1-decarboxylase [Syntrophotalea carbinolica DSM 2380]